MRLATALPFKNSGRIEDVIIRVEIFRYAKDHPLKIWKKGDVSSSKILSSLYCCDEMRELWDLKAIGFDSRKNKIWIYLIDPSDIDYGSEATMMECKFCPFCGQQIHLIEEGVEPGFRNDKR